MGLIFVIIQHINFAVNFISVPHSMLSISPSWWIAWAPVASGAEWNAKNSKYVRITCRWAVNIYINSDSIIHEFSGRNISKRMFGMWRMHDEISPLNTFPTNLNWKFTHANQTIRPTFIHQTESINCNYRGLAGVLLTVKFIRSGEMWQDS